jgi:hypothetical protein
VIVAGRRVVADGRQPDEVRPGRVLLAWDRRAAIATLG